MTFNLVDVVDSFPSKDLMVSDGQDSLSSKSDPTRKPLETLLPLGMYNDIFKSINIMINAK